jgi:hypothetical protein
MKMSNQLSSPGPSNASVAKPTSGKQDQGSNIDVTNYANVNVGKAGGTTISTQMNTPLGKIPTGGKDGSL